MNTRFGHVAYMKLWIRLSTLNHFCRNFNIEILKNVKTPASHFKDSLLDDNFVFFLMENKTFIRIYDLDYYSDKSIEIIANKIGRSPVLIEQYLKTTNYKIDSKYPFRYISSYKIDFDLGGYYDFLKFDSNKIYEGNFECRRKS